jgi:hypothetical protein
LLLLVCLALVQGLWVLLFPAWATSLPLLLWVLHALLERPCDLLWVLLQLGSLTGQRDVMLAQ